jgi:glucose-1-phosphate adenylyltransferase
VERSVLSPNVRVNSYSLVQDAVLMEGVNVGRHAKIRRAIVDKDVVIPPGAEIGYDAEADRQRFVVTEKGIVVVAKGTGIEQPVAVAGAR